MSFTNAFDLGACTVSVFRAGVPDFSGVLAKGGSAAVNDVAYAGLTVSVSAGGVVALNNPNLLGIEDVFEVQVTPAYSMLAAAGIHVLAPTSSSGTGNATSNGSMLVGFVNGDAVTDLTGQPSPDSFDVVNTLVSGASTTPILQFTPEADMVTPPDPPTSYNCDCDDDFPTSTLDELTRRIIVRLGYAAMSVAPPGMTELVQDFLIQAQKLLFRQYKCFRTERWFTWDMPAGQRFFDFGANNDVCNKKLDPRLITWVGVSEGDNNWRELISGINPVRYTSKYTGLSQWFEVRQCIEVWPAMSDSSWQLRIKGIFGLLPFAAGTDVTTIDAEPIFMLALGNAKAHYGQQDAGNSIRQLSTYIGSLTAGNQPRRRFFPGDRVMPNAVPPKIV